MALAEPVGIEGKYALAIDLHHKKVRLESKLTLLPYAPIRLKPVYFRLSFPRPKGQGNWIVIRIFLFEGPVVTTPLRGTTNSEVESDVVILVMVSFLIAFFQLPVPSGAGLKANPIRL
jgi:hypothetical protein